MDSSPSTLLVLPCYDEAHRLEGEAFSRALASRPWLRLLFVDDGSTDATGAILKRLADGHERIDLLALPANRGKAGAVHAGLAVAMATDAARIGYWDSDLATPLEAVDDLSREMDRADAFLAMGARVGLLGRRIERSTLRHYVGRVFATGASLVLGLPVYDTQCGAKLIRNDAVAREILGPPFRTGWIFDVEILARLVRYDRIRGTSLARDRVVEVPLRQWIDVAGSKVRLRDGVRAAADLVRVAQELRAP